MSQPSPGNESVRAKFLLVSIACVVIGLIVAIIPVQATQTFGSISNYSVGNSLRLNLGHAEKDYVIVGSLMASGLYRVEIENVWTGSTLFRDDVNGITAVFPTIIVANEGDIQIEVTRLSGGSSAILNASIQHSTTSYPLMIPGILILVLGGVLMLTRGLKIGSSLTGPARVR